jgi:hypothetical protein
MVVIIVRMVMGNIKNKEIPKKMVNVIEDISSNISDKK